MKIAIFPGSFKPPHLGHIQMIEELITAPSPFSDIYIFISYKPRPLEPKMYMFSQLPLSDMFEILLPYDKNIKRGLTKKEYINEYDRLVDEGKIPVFNVKQSIQIWKIYEKYLLKKYKKELINTKLHIQISYAPSPILSVYQLVNRLIKKEIPSNDIYLVKSKKNSSNSRFDYLKKKYPKIHTKIVTSKNPDIHSTLLRKSILDKNYKDFISYLPKDLSPSDKKKIWYITQHPLTTIHSSK